MKNQNTPRRYFFKALWIVALGSVIAQTARALPSDAALRELAERLAIEDAPGREVAVEQLTQTGLAAVPFVANFIPAKEPGVRDAAIRVLQQIGMEAAIAHCINSLNSPNEQVRYRAANALSIMTNRHFGYSPQDTPAKRAQIIARWNKWWVEWQATLQTQPQP